MNILHMKYAVEVARCGSINKAAESFLIGQPNLSRAIRELEASLGIRIFERSAKGMMLTPEGEVFMEYAKNILKQVNTVETMFKQGAFHGRRFFVAAPHSSYVSEAFARFSALLGNSNGVELFYKETDLQTAVGGVLNDEYKIAIIRYPENCDKYYKSMLEEKKLDYELICEFEQSLIMSKNCPLAKKENISEEDLGDYTEVLLEECSALQPFVGIKKEKVSGSDKSKIYVYERSSLFEMLSVNPKVYMWSSPISAHMLGENMVVRRLCPGGKRSYKDLLIYKKGYKLSKLDGMFIEQLIKTKREIIKN